MIASNVALTVDVEDAHHGLDVQGRSSTLDNDVNWILDEFRKHELHGTFFVLGELLDSHANLIKKIASDGHEVGFHGARHRFLRDEGPVKFASGLRSSIPRLEDLTGSRVYGFRAPFFSIVPETAWCLDILASQSFEYDASIYPGRNDRYGWPGAPVSPVRYGTTGLVLFPVPLLHPKLPVGFSGGAYLRLLPHRFVEWGLRRAARLGQPGMVYVHPWEIAARLRWRNDARLRANLTRHLLRQRMRPQLTRLLASGEAKFGTMRSVIENLPSLPIWNPADNHPG